MAQTPLASVSMTLALKSLTHTSLASMALAPTVLFSAAQVSTTLTLILAALYLKSLIL
jgi:hypothetical protein